MYLFIAIIFWMATIAITVLHIKGYTFPHISEILTEMYDPNDDAYDLDDLSLFVVLSLLVGILLGLVWPITLFVFGLFYFIDDK